MIPLVSFAQTATYETTPSELRLPPSVWNLFILINRVHAGWRWYRKAELYTTPNRFFELLGGHALNFLVGDLLIVRLAAQALLIATRILECTQQQAALCKEGRRWSATLREHGWAGVEVRKPSRCRSRWLSPSAQCALENAWMRLAARVKQIARHTFKLFVRTFRLSMGIMDVVDAISLHPHTHHDAVNESLVNLVKWIDTIVENHKELLGGIAHNKQIIARLLEKSPMTYDQFYAGLEKTIQGTRTVQKKMLLLSSSSRKLAWETSKRIANNSLVILGLGDLATIGGLAP